MPELSKETADSDRYRQRRRDMRKLLTIYGRKPVLEALQDDALQIAKLHLASSNRAAAILDQIEALASSRGIAVEFHDKRALSRISRNARQDQGVAADIELPTLRWLEELAPAELAAAPARFLLCDGIVNPQNLGMIIRSVAAAGISGLILPLKGNASLSPLVIKASAGAVFRCPVFLAEDIEDALRVVDSLQLQLYTLSADAADSLLDMPAAPGNAVFVLGNETQGHGSAVTARSSGSFCIPLANGVESLNVAVTGALVAFALRGR